jgi:transposase
MVFENTRAKKDAVKLDIIRYAQRLGNKAAARRFGCSKNTVKLWRRRYETQGMFGLEDCRRGPNDIPHKTSSEEEKRIIECRMKAPCYGPKRLKWAYNIQASEGAIARILKVNGLTRRPRKKYQRKQDLRAAKAAAYQALSHHQEDVKHLYDIPYYWEQLQRLGLPRYEYTLRDTKSGFLLLGFSKEYSENYSTIITEYYLNHLKAYHIDLSGITIQTDNGSEFGGGKKNIQTPGFVNTIVCGYNAHHQFIPPGMCNANADVESIHLTIEREFFDIESFTNVQDFWIKVQAYQLFYNLVRPNYSKGGKTPSQIILEERPNVDPKILFFPVLDLDEEFRKLHGLEKINVSGGQTLHKLPVFFVLRSDILNNGYDDLLECGDLSPLS